MQGRRESNGVEIIKFADGDANKNMDLNRDDERNRSIEAMEQLMHVDCIAVASFMMKMVVA